jgi:hypothetical protein
MQPYWPGAPLKEPKQAAPNIPQGLKNHTHATHLLHQVNDPGHLSRHNLLPLLVGGAPAAVLNQRHSQLVARAAGLEGAE